MNDLSTETKSLAIQLRNSLPDVYHRYGLLATMKSAIIGLHLAIKTDLLEQIILPSIDWQSYSMPPEMISMIKAETIALEKQDAEAVYVDEGTGKNETVRRFDLITRLVRANGLNLRGLPVRGLPVPVFFSWNLNNTYENKYDAATMVCCGISDLLIVNNRKYARPANRQRPWTEEVSHLVADFNVAAIKLLHKQLNLKTVEISIPGDGLTYEVRYNNMGPIKRDITFEPSLLVYIRRRRKYCECCGRYHTLVTYYGD
ncbi:MAG: hypothetical protein M1812_004965 [Candelaria pacifica]|nr:MAG: hypothetical protein M1812_004965 [Candelaria pacifica]